MLGSVGRAFAWWGDLGMRTKLLSGFGLMLAVTVAVGSVGYKGVQRLEAEIDELHDNALVPTRHVVTASQLVVAFDRDVLTHVMVQDPERMAAITTALADRESEIKRHLAEYRKTPQAEKLKEKVDQLDEAWKALRQATDEILSLSSGGRKAEAQAQLDGAYRQIVDFIDGFLVDLSRVNEDLANTARESAAATVASLRLQTFMATIGAFLVGLVLALTLAGGITRPLHRVVALAKQVGDVDLANLTRELNALAKGELGRELRLAAAPLDMRRRDELGQLASAFNGMIARLTEAGGAFRETSATLGQVSQETHALSRGAVEGNLSVRGDATKFEGAYRDIIVGVNATLDSVIGPLNVAAEYVDRIAKGDIPPRITETYRGDFNELKNNLNTCIEAVQALVTDTAALSSAAVEGQLSTRADATRHRGDFRRAIEGVNATLDAVIGPLNMAAEYVDRISKGEIPSKITATRSTPAGTLSRQVFS